MSKIQRGGNGSTSVRNPRTFRGVTYRPFPVHQEGFLVGARNSDYGVSNLMGQNGRPMSFTIQHNPRKIIDHRDFEQFVKIGIEEPFFPDITISGAQAGAGQSGGRSIANQLIRKTGRAVKSVGKTAGHIGKQLGKDVVKAGKVIGKATVDHKLLSKGFAGLSAISKLGGPATAGFTVPLGVAGTLAGLAGLGEQEGGDSNGQRVGGRQRFDFNEAIGYATNSGRRSAKILHSQVFDPLHPGNYPRASLNDLA